MTDPQPTNNPFKGTSRSDLRRQDNAPAPAPEARPLTFDDILGGQGKDRDLSTEDDALPFFQDVSADLDNHEDFIKDPTDFTDRATEVRQTKRRRTILFAALGLLSLAAVGFFFTQLLVTSTASRDVAPISEETSAPTAPDSDTATPSESVFLKDFPAGVTPPVEEILITQEAASPTAFTATNGRMVDVLGATLTPVAQGCTVLKPTDFCFTGSGVASDVPFDVYFFKDIVQSKLFSPVNDSSPVTISGAKAAYKVFVNFGGAGETAGVAIAFEDGTGYFVTTTDAAAVDKLAPLIAAL